jgi:hypothetical protein
MHNLRAVLAGEFVERTFEAGASGLECSRRDVVLQKFAVYDIDDSGDEGFDVFGSIDQGFNVVCGSE